MELRNDLVFSTRELSGLLNVSTRQLIYWDNAGLVLCDRGGGRNRQWDFRAAVLAAFTARLLDGGVRHTRLRRVLKQARGRLLVAQFFVLALPPDGRERVYWVDEREQIVAQAERLCCPVLVIDVHTMCGAIARALARCAGFSVDAYQLVRQHQELAAVQFSRNERASL